MDKIDNNEVCSGVRENSGWRIWTKINKFKTRVFHLVGRLKQGTRGEKEREFFHVTANDFGEAKRLI